MSFRFKILAASFVLLLVFLIPGFLACSQTNKQASEESKERKIPIEVIQDDLYNFQQDDVIGKVEFHKFRGPVGSRLTGKCIIDRLSSFPDRQVDVEIRLLNEDAARVGFTSIHWVQDTNQKAFTIFVPLVETVPVILNFQVLVYAGSPVDDDTADDATDDAADDAADDTAADDTASDDTVAGKAADDDDTAAGDDTASSDSTAVYPFMAGGTIPFVVNDGKPGVGD